MSMLSLTRKHLIESLRPHHPVARDLHHKHLVSLALAVDTEAEQTCTLIAAAIRNVPHAAEYEPENVIVVSDADYPVPTDGDADGYDSTAVKYESCPECGWDDTLPIDYELCKCPRCEHEFEVLA